MVAVITSESLGVYTGSLSELGGRGAYGQPQLGRQGGLVYINAASGNLVIQQRDEFLTSLGQDFSLTRTYNSQGLMNDDNGDNFRFSFNQRLTNLTGTANTSGSTITRINGDGAASVFTYDSTTGLYLSTDGAGAHDSLSYNATTQVWTYTEGSSRLRETYDWNGSAGKVLSVIDRDGNTTSYGYHANGFINKITDASNQTLTISYSGNNVTQVSTASSGVTQTRVHYSYDLQNRLSQVKIDLSPEDNSIIDNAVYTTTYTYEGTSTRVASITQSDGATVSFTYVNDAGSYKIKTVTDGQGKVTTFNYPLAGQTDVTDPLGQLSTYRYDSSGRLIEVLSPAVNGARLSTTYSYDADGNLAGVNDGAGNTISYHYDTHGNLTRERDGLGNTVDYSYNGTQQLLSETHYRVVDPDGSGPAQPSGGQTTHYVYDAENHLRFVISATGQVSENRYDAAGNLVNVIQYTAGQYTAASYTESALSTWTGTQNLSQTQRLDTAYDFRGQVQHTTRYASVNATGVGVVDGSEAKTHYIYDQRGYLLKTVAAKGIAPTETASAAPSTVGHQLNNYETLYIYDGLGRLLSTTDSLGHLTTTEYDDANKKIVSTAANGLITTSVYDNNGRLVSVSDSQGLQALGTTSYSYDANGRLLSVTDPLNRVHHHFSDAEGRLSARINANNTLTENRYDGAGNLTHSITYATALSAAQVTSLLSAAAAVPSTLETALATVITAIKGLGDRTEHQVYNGAHQLVYQIDAEGAVQHFFYDGVGQLTDTLRYNTLIAHSSLTATPTVAEVAALVSSHSDDRHSRQFYDADGRVIASLDGAGYLTEQRYDQAGQLIESIAYANAINPTLHNTGNFSELKASVTVDSNRDQHSYFFYNGHGQTIGVLDGEGYLTEYSYDAHGNETEVIRYANRAKAYTGSETLAQLRPLANGNDQVTVKTYTARDKLATQTRKANATAITTTAYSYDAMGQLLETTRAVGEAEVRTTRTRYDVQGRILSQLSGQGSAVLDALVSPTQAEIDQVWDQYGVDYIYNVAGQRTQITDATGNVLLFYYDQAGREALSINGNGDVVETHYTAFGEVSETIRYATHIDLTGLSGGAIPAPLTTWLDTHRNDLGNVRTQTLYSLRGAVKQAIDGLGKSTHNTINAFGEITQVTSPINGTATRSDLFTYNKRGLLTQSTQDSGGANRSTSLEYDAFGRVVQRNDGLNTPTVFAYDKLGRVVSTATGSGSVLSTHTTYDAFGRVLTHTDARGNTTSSVFDDANRSVTLTTPEGVSITTVFNRHGEQVSVNDGNGQITQYRYDNNGNLTAVEDALGQVTQTQYDKDNRVIATINAKGTRTTFTYDSANRLLTRTVDAGDGSTANPLNLITSYSYDGIGRQVSITDANGIVTQSEYDANGQVTAVVVDPTGLNLRTEYSYDDRGMRLSVTEGAGTTAARVSTHQYDKLGRRIQTTQDPGGLNIVTTFVYDGNDNLIKTTEAAGTSGARISVFAYDEHNRQTYRINALGEVSETLYDANGNVIKSINYANALDGVTLNSLHGNPATALSAVAAALIPDTQADRVQRRVFDQDNRALYSIDSLGYVVEFNRDGNGNMTRQIRYVNALTGTTLSAVDSNPETAQSNIAGALVGNAQDRYSWTAYDAVNQAAYSIDAMGFVVANSYDGAGNLTANTRYYDAIATGALGGVVSVGTVESALAARVSPQSAKDQIDRHNYDGANRLVSTTDAEGFSEHYAYDGRGNRISFTNKKGAVWRYDYDAADRQIRETTPLVTVTQVDPVTLVATQSQEAIITEMSYDALGNLLSRTEAAGTSDARTTHYIYDALGRQTQITFPSQTFYDAAADQTANHQGRNDTVQTPISRTFYDSLGNAVVSKDVLGRYSYKTYDALGRVLYEIDAERNVTEYSYDAFSNELNLTRYATAIAESTFTLRETTGLVSGFNDSEMQSLLTANSADRTLIHQYDLLNRRTQTEQPAVYSYDSSAGSGNRRFTASPVTQTFYNSFGDVLQQRALVNSHTGQWADTTYYYDNRGNQIAKVDALGYLSTWERDATGNIVAHTEYAVALSSWSIAGHAAPTTTTPQNSPNSAIGHDRVMHNDYDRLNQKVSATKVNVEYSQATYGGTVGLDTVVGDITTRYRFDATGNLIAVTDDNGATTYNYYDALGRHIASASPSRVSEGLGSLSLPPLHISIDRIYWQQTGFANSQISFQYREVGASTWLTATVASVGDDYQVDISSWGSGRYEYHITYTRNGETTPYIDGSGKLDLPRSMTAASSSQVVGKVEIPYINETILSQRNFVPSKPGSGQQSVWKGTNSVALGWSDLSHWGDGQVRISMTYQAKDHTGDTRSRSLTISRNAADAATGVVINWAGGSGGYKALASVTSVKVEKFINGAWITVHNGKDAFNQERLLLWGATTGLTAVDIAGVGQRLVTEVAAGSGIYTVDVGDLAGGNYSYTLVGTAFSAAREMHVAGTGAGALTVSERADAALSEDIVDRTYWIAGTPKRGKDVPAVPGRWGGANRVDLSWDSLASWGSGNVRVTLSYRGVRASGNKSNRARSHIYNAADAAEGVIFKWNEGGDKNTYNRLAGINNVKVEKFINGAWVTLYNQPDTAAVPVLDINGLPSTAAEVVLSYRPVGSTGPYLVKTASQVTSGWFNVGYDDLADGRYDYQLSVKDSLGAAIDLTALGGTVDGTIDGQLQIRRSGDSLATLVPSSDKVLIPLTENHLDRYGNQVMQTRYAEGAASATADGYTLAQQSATQDQRRYQRYDSYGNMLEQIDAEGARVYFAYDAKGQVVKRWQTATTVDNATQQLITLHEYDRVGRQTATGEVVDGLGTVDRHDSAYNAFGEIVSKGLNGGGQEFFHYDNAGRLWRSNKENGVTKVYLYNLAGEATAVIRSANHDLTTYSTAADVAALTDVARSETEYNLLNQAVKTTEASFSQNTGLDSVNALVLTVSTDTLSWEKAPQVGTSVEFKYRVIGATTWTVATVTDTTTHHKIDISTWLDDQYEYELRYTRAGETSPYAFGGGNFAVSSQIGTSTSQHVMGITEESTLGYHITSQATYVPQQNCGKGCNLAAHWTGTNAAAMTWNSLSHWGDGNVRVTLYYQGRNRENNATNKARSVIYNAATADSGVTMSWNPSSNAATTNHARMHSIRFVKVEKFIEGQWVQVQNGTTHTDPVHLRLWGNTTGLTAINIDGVGQRNVTALNAGGNIYTVDVSDLAAGQYHFTPVGSSSGVGGVFFLPTTGSSDLQFTIEPPTEELQTFTPVKQQSLDRWGNVLSTIDPRDASYISEYRYDHNNQVVLQQLPQTDVWNQAGVNSRARPTTHIHYDNLGQRLGVVDANGGVQGVRYDDAGQVVTKYDALGGQQAQTYDAFGNILSKADALGNQTIYTYDHNNRLLSEQDVLSTTTYAYDEVGRRISVTNGENETTEYAYDIRGNLILTRLPLGAGNAATTYYTAATYDARGNKTGESNGNNDSQSWVYNYFGQVQSHTDMGGVVTTYTYNSNDRTLSSQSDTGGQALSYSYYENGRLKQIDDTAQGYSTLYHYDLAGNRTRERFMNTTDRTVHQDAQLQFDELGRVAFIRDTRFTLNYKYDAHGNRRNTYSEYYDHTATLQNQDFWYLYDANHRITLSQGVLNTGKIDISQDQGTQLGYDGQGNRRTAKYYEGTTLVEDSYNYDSRNRLADINRAGATTTARQYDLANRVTEQSHFSSPGVLSERQVRTYNANGWFTRQENFNGGGAKTATIRYDHANSYDAVGNVKYYTLSVHTGTTYDNSYTYNYIKADGYRESVINGSKTVHHHTGNATSTGKTTSTYDLNGNLIKVVDQFNRVPTRDFIVNSSGVILQKHQNDDIQYYYYANNQTVGSEGSLTDADFDFNYTPVSEQFPASTPGSYVLGQGDTLQSISLAVYGDAKLWYLIADANGLAGDSDLVPGMTLTIPNVVSNLHNNADTFKPYKPGAIIGDTTPTLPDPPPPPDKNAGGSCQNFGEVIITMVVAVITAVIAIYMPASIKGAGPLVASIIGATAAATLGQTVLAVSGVQERPNPVAIATAALAAGLTTALAPVDIVDPVVDQALRATLSNSLTQGINIATGYQSEFDWRGVAIAAFMAPLSAGLDGALGTGPTEDGLKLDLESFSRELGASIIKGFVRETVNLAAYNKGRFEWSSVAADAFGNALGNSLVNHQTAIDRTRELRAKQIGFHPELEQVSDADPSKPVDDKDPSRERRPDGWSRGPDGEWRLFRRTTNTQAEGPGGLRQWDNLIVRDQFRYVYNKYTEKGEVPTYKKDGGWRLYIESRDFEFLKPEKFHLKLHVTASANVARNAFEGLTPGGAGRAASQVRASGGASRASGSVVADEAAALRRMQEKQAAPGAKALNERINSRASNTPAATRDANGVLRTSDGRFATDDTIVRSQLNRPTLRSQTKAKIEANVPKNSQGQFLDQNGKVIADPHFGHIRGHENRRILSVADELGITQSQLNDYVNARPQFFKIEPAKRNLSHVDELPGRDNIGHIAEDMKDFLGM